MEKFEELLIDLYGIDVGFELSHTDPTGGWLREDGLPFLEDLLDPYPIEFLLNRVAFGVWIEVGDPNGLRGMLKITELCDSRSTGEEVSEALLTSGGSKAFSSLNTFPFMTESESWELWNCSKCSDETGDLDLCSAIPDPGSFAQPEGQY